MGPCRFRALACAGAIACLAAPAGAQELQAAPAPETDDDKGGDEAFADLAGPGGQVVTVAPGGSQVAPAVAAKMPFVLGGYADIGFFVPSGNGAGWVQDTGAKRAFPGEADRFGWVFLGDILAPAINSRGEVADLGDAPGVQRFDGIDSNGAAGFLVNEANLTATAGVADNVVATTSVNFAPRSGAHFAAGDVFDVDLAQIEWLPGVNQRTSIFVGKMESVLGIEYRERKARDRFGITPSLLARYTTGTPIGIKVRSKLGPDDRLVLAGAVTNGSSGTEMFHFYDEVDSNPGKTVSGRASFRLPLPFDLELGLSGLLGPQDRALDSRNPIWFFGVDLLARVGWIDIKGQYLVGGARGETDRRYDERHRPYGLDLNGGGYLEADWMLTPMFGVLGRAEVRDARVWLGDEKGPERADRLYLTKSWRGTVGVRVVWNAHMTLKAEYLRNGEYGGVPGIANDVFTSSLVWVY